MARMNKLSAGNVRTLFFCSFFFEKGFTFLLQFFFGERDHFSFAVA